MNIAHSTPDKSVLERYARYSTLVWKMFCAKGHVDDHASPLVGRQDAGASGVGETRTATECLAIAELPVRVLLVRTN